MTDIAQGPLQTLMSLLNPDNQQWLKNQTPQRQQELARSFEENPFGASDRGANIQNMTSLADLSGKDELTGRANKFIEMEKANDEGIKGMKNG